MIGDYQYLMYSKEFIKDFLYVLITKYDNILIAGDFNVHVHVWCPSKPLAKEFLDLVDAFDFVLHVTEPTQEHTLALVLLDGFIINIVKLCGAVF